MEKSACLRVTVAFDINYINVHQNYLNMSDALHNLIYTIYCFMKYKKHFKSLAILGPAVHRLEAHVHV